jgi:ABC-type antimicrobial peptide transport system permease subunit
VVGLLAAAGAARLVAGILFGVSPNDPLTNVLAAATLAAVSLIAGYLPARRAARIDPMAALRHE